MGDSRNELDVRAAAMADVAVSIEMSGPSDGGAERRSHIVIALIGAAAVVLAALIGLVGPGDSQSSTQSSTATAASNSSSPSATVTVSQPPTSPATTGGPTPTATPTATSTTELSDVELKDRRCPDGEIERIRDMVSESRPDLAFTLNNAELIHAAAGRLPHGNIGCAAAVVVPTAPAIVIIDFACPDRWRGCIPRPVVLDLLTDRAVTVFQPEAELVLRLFAEHRIESIGPRHSDGHGYFYDLFLDADRTSCGALLGTYGGQPAVLGPAARNLLLLTSETVEAFPWVAGEPEPVAPASEVFDVVFGRVELAGQKSPVAVVTVTVDFALPRAVVTAADLAGLRGSWADERMGCWVPPVFERIARVP